MNSDTVWLVYHYRGPLVFVSSTEAVADAWIDAQKIPSEYYDEEWIVTTSVKGVTK